MIVFAATGTGPFGSGPQASLLYRVVHAVPAITEVPGGLRELAAGCLAKVPADRPRLAALESAIAAARAPDEGDALASFWPVTVTGLIRSHQARLATELREGSTGPGPGRDGTGGDGDGAAGTVPADGAGRDGPGGASGRGAGRARAGRDGAGRDSASANVGPGDGAGRDSDARRGGRRSGNGG